MAAMNVSIVATLVDAVSGPAKAVQASLLGIGTAAKTATTAAAGSTAAVAASGAAIGATAANYAKMGAVIGTAAVGLGAFKYAMNSLDEGRSFDQAMTNVRKVMNLSRQEFIPYKDALFDLANEYPVKFEDVAESFRFSSRLNRELGFMKDFAKLGLDVQSAFDVDATTAAESSKNIMNSLIGSATPEGLKSLTAIMDGINVLDNQFKGSTAKNILNFVNRTAGVGKLAHFTGQDLAAVGATFEALGQNAERTAVNFANAMSYMMVGGRGAQGKVEDSLKKLSYKGTKEFQKVLEKDGVKGFVNLMERVSKIASESDRMNVLKNLFGQFQARYLAFLADEKGLKYLREALGLTRDLATYTGNLADEAETARGGYEQLWEKMDQRWRNLRGAVGIAVAPMVLRIGTALAGVAEVLSEVVAKFPEFSGAAIGAAAAFGTLAAAITPLKMIFAGMAFGPALIAAGALSAKIVAIAAAAALIYANWDKATEAFNKFRAVVQDEGLKAALMDLGAEIGEGIQPLLDKLAELTNYMNRTTLGGLYNDVFGGGKEAYGPPIPGTEQPMLQQFMAGYYAFINSLRTMWGGKTTEPYLLPNQQAAQPNVNAQTSVQQPGPQTVNVSVPVQVNASAGIKVNSATLNLSATVDQVIGASGGSGSLNGAMADGVK